MKIDNSTIPPEMEDQVRCICYDFGDAFLDLTTIGTTCALPPMRRLE